MFDPLTALTIALKTSLLFVVVGLVAFLMARQSAAWRHFLWTAALALALLMPLAVAYLPSSVQVPLPVQAAETWALDEAAPVASGGLRDTTAGSERNGTRADNSPMRAREIRSAWPFAMIVWLIGALCVLLHNALAHVGLMRWIRKARSDLSPAWAATLRRVQREAGVQRSLRVLESDHTASPCTWGFVRPVILLPAAGADWPEPQRRFTLLHELAHVRRLDYLTTQISNLACAIHWYNPLAWFAAARSRKLQEQACDDAVLQAGGAPSDYARFLVGIADDSRREKLLALPAAVGMVQRSQLHGRVTAILDATRARLPLNGAALLVALIPLACLMLLLATVTAVASSAAPQASIPLTSSFNSVELRNGGMVILRHGQSPSVTVLKGDPEEHGIAIRDDGRLVIDHCAKGCSVRHDFEVEVVTPDLAAIAVAHGGTIQTRGDFPQPEIAATVTQGGTIDIRSLTLANLTAAVDNGGRIFAKPESTLSATIEHGGAVTYWGDIIVDSSIEDGGVVVAGWPEDADKPLAELGAAKMPPPEPVPPVPAVPALPPPVPTLAPPVPASQPQGE